MNIKIILVLLLFIAVFDLPYGYYQFLRIVVFAGMCYIIYFENKMSVKWLNVLYALIGILFNPIIPIHFTRGLWFYLDIIAGIVIILSIFIQKPLSIEKIAKMSKLN